MPIIPTPYLSYDKPHGIDMVTKEKYGFMDGKGINNEIYTLNTNKEIIPYLGFIEYTKSFHKL